MQITPGAQTVVRIAIILLIIAAISAIWELLARQAPGSIFYLGLLPGPIASLRNTSTILGLALIEFAWLLPWLSQPKEPRYLIRLAILGIVLTISANFYAALHGMYGIQISDPRPDTTPLFWVKYGGYALLGICLIDLARRILFHCPFSQNPK